MFACHHQMWQTKLWMILDKIQITLSHTKYCIYHSKHATILKTECYQMLWSDSKFSHMTGNIKQHSQVWKWGWSIFPALKVYSKTYSHFSQNCYYKSSLQCRSFSSIMTILANNKTVSDCIWCEYANLFREETTVYTLTSQVKSYFRRAISLCIAIKCWCQLYECKFPANASFGGMRAIHNHTFVYSQQMPMLAVQR